MKFWKILIVGMLICGCSPRRMPSREQRQHHVFIDAGHGGHDVGAKYIRVLEKDLCLETVLIVERFLSSWGYKVSMSRRNDTFVPLLRRVEMSKKSDVLVSIHYNSSKNHFAKGVEVYYFETPKTPIRVARSKRLASCVICRLSSALPTNSRGVKHGNFCMVREPRIPAVLVETAFITNSKEAALLHSSEYKQQIGWAIAKGIDDYFQSM